MNIEQNLTLMKSGNRIPLMADNRGTFPTHDLKMAENRDRLSRNGNFLPTNLKDKCAMNTQTEIKWLTVKDVADRTYAGESSVRRWIKNKILRAYKLGRDWKIDPADFREFMERRSNFSD